MNDLETKEKDIEKIINNLNLEETKQVLKNVIRVAPEPTKDVIMYILDDIGQGKNLQLNKVCDIEEKMQYFKNIFNKINNFELYYCAKITYNNDYYYDEEEYEYYDYDSVGEEINSAYSFAVNLVNLKKYTEACFIFDSILFSNYQAFSEEIGEYLELELIEMYDNKLIKFDVKELCLYTIYSNYQAHGKEERAKTIYDYMIMALFQNVKLKEAFHLGVEPILDEKNFWREYLTLLSLEKGDKEYALLKEAIEETGHHWEVIFDLPSQIYKNHPKLFLDYLNFLKSMDADEKIIAVGDNILRKVDDSLIVRSKIACVVAESLIKVGVFTNIKDYFYQIFASNSNSINLLRVLLYQNCFSVYKNSIKEIIEKAKKRTPSLYTPVELTVNRIDDNTYKYLRFFLGDINIVVNVCRKNKIYLGWRDDFIRNAVDLLMLYLYKDTKLTSDVHNLIENILLDLGDDNTICLFENIDDKATDVDNYWIIFQTWRNQYKIDDNLREEILDLLEEIIDKRVEAIVGNCYRSSYSKVAKLIVVFSSVLKSNGKSKGLCLIDNYLHKYPRHTAFRSEIKKLLARERK